MFERFTNRARRVLVVAQDEARNLNHSAIGPEHLLLGLMQGEGVAAKALSQFGISLEDVRTKVAGTLTQAKDSIREAKLPLSGPAKRVLEMALREALRLGHNYIGTEHLMLGVLDVGDAGAVTEVFGVAVDVLRSRLLEVMRNDAVVEPPTSAAVVDAIRRGQELSGSDPLTTGQLLAAILADDACQASKGLKMLGVTPEALASKLAEIPIASTSDAPPRPRSVEVSLGQLRTTIEDPALVAAIANLTPEQLIAALRGAFGMPPDNRAAG